MPRTRELFEAEKVYNVKAKQYDQPKNTIEYVKQYIYPMNNGVYYLYVPSNNTFEYYEFETIKRCYLNKLDKSVNNYFSYEYSKLFKAINDINKPIIDNIKLEINLCSGFLYKNVEPFEDADDKAIDSLRPMLQYINEVLANDSEEVHQYLIKWLANMCQGNKNDSCLYLKGIEGIGKSTLTDFLHDYVLGDKIALKLNTTSVLTTENNSILIGRVLAVFEELPALSDGSWSVVSSKLKDMITSKTNNYCNKYEKMFVSNNMNNYIINTNCDALKNAEGRRIFCLDVSTKHKGDHKYFGELRDACFNSEVGRTFFRYLKSIDVSHFKAQDMPSTATKTDAFVKRLCPVYQFLKMKYIKTKQDIFILLNDLYAEYTLFFMEEGNKISPLSKIDFNAKLKDVGIISYLVHGVNKIKISYIELKKIADKGHWIHELDEIDNLIVNEVDNLPINYDNVPVAFMDEMANIKSENTTLKLEMAELKKLLNSLKKPETVVKPKSKVPVLLEKENDNDLLADVPDLDDMFDKLQVSDALAPLAKSTKKIIKTAKPKMINMFDD